MPRNRYTRLIRTSERTQLAHQEKQLTQLIHQLRRGIPEVPLILPQVGAKERRTARLTQKRLHKPARLNHDAENMTAIEGSRP